MLGRLEPKPGRVVLVDCAGGAYLVTLGDVCQLDAAVVVVEPYPRSAEVARRLIATLSEKASATRTVVVANKIGNDSDLEAVRRFLPQADIEFVVPLDPSVVDADARGLAPIDVAPEGPVVRACEAIAATLLAVPAH